MGKRELLLIGGFILMGMAVYALTAPDAARGGSGVSITTILDQARRELRGNHSAAEVESTTTTPVASAVREIRVEARTVSLTVIGEDRADIASQLKVHSTGYDEAEARKYAQETKLKLTEAGDTVIVEIDYPRPAEQRSTLVVRVPKRFAVRVQPNRGKLEVRGVAAVDFVEVRGEVTIADVSGRVAVQHRGGKLTIDAVDTLKLNTRGSIVALSNVKGSTTLVAQAGEVRGVGLHGPVDIDSNNTELLLEDLKTTAASVRLNVVGGSVKLAGVRQELRLDAREAKVSVAIDKPAPISIYTEGDETLDVIVPEGGFTLDALAMQSQLTMPEGMLEVKSTEQEQRASGPVAGGGPTITLRSSRGAIAVTAKKPTT